MHISRTFAAADISASGLKAERMRMEVAANNIANAHATRSASGGPYRRQQVIFAAPAPNSGTAPDTATLPELQGVEIVGIAADRSPFPRVYNPGHPDADPQGYLEMPNVVLPMEMVDLMTASRSYEANLKAMQTYRQMTEQTLSLLQQLR